MPNQDPTNTNNNQSQENTPANPISSIPFSPQVDLPPLPPEFQNVESSQADLPPTAGSVPPNPSAEESGSAAPQPTFANIAGTPKKKFGTNKIIATILGILVLIGGVAVATYTVGQKQLFKQKADTSCSTCPSGWEPLGGYCVKGGGCPSAICGTCAYGDWTYDSSTGSSYCSGDLSVTCAAACMTCPPVGQSPLPTPTPNCGKAPDPIPTFTKTPTQVGPFTATGNLVIYYVGLETKGLRTVYITSHDGSHVVNIDTSDKSRIVTSVPINAGETVTINKIEEQYQGRPMCAVESGPPYLSLGWMPVNSDTTCGSGLIGPPTEYIRFSKPSVASAITWMQGFNDPSPVGQQCWADWMEWIGDYDFNDYFLMYAVTTEEAPPSCSAITTYDSSWNLIEAGNRGSLKSGTTVNFCLAGGITSGTYDMARFTINGVQQADTTQKRPGSSDFCQSYTIPEGTTTFTVTGQIHHSILGWF